MNSNIEVKQDDFRGEIYEYINVTNTLNSNDLIEIEHVVATKNVHSITFDYEQHENTWKEMNRIIRTHNSSILLHFRDYHVKLEDLSFLEHLPDLKRLSISYFKGTDLSPIAHLKQLKTLRFHAPFKSARVRLKPLIGLKQLEEFEIFHIKDIEETKNFINLKKITLERLKVNNLDFLKPLVNLEEIALRSSDHIVDYSGMYDLPKMEYAFILKNYKDTSAEFLSHLKHVKRISIYDFNSVSHFPSLEKLDKLTDLSITSWKILSDISGVAKAPNLETLSLFVGAKFKPSALNVLKGHKKLREIRVGFHTNKENEEGEKLIEEILKNNGNISTKV